MPNKTILAALAFALIVPAAVASTPPPEEDPKVDTSPYTYVRDDEKAPYTCQDDPGWWFTLTDGFDAAREAGCRPVNVLRRAANPMHDIVCWANECCKYEIRTSPSGWPVVVLVCKLDEVKCPTIGQGGWPTPPPP